jgi:hypothetical protein
MNVVNKSKKIASKSAISEEEQEEELQVSGLTDSGSGKPNIEFATDEQDMPLTEQLYRGKHRPLMGEGAHWND